MSQPDRPDIRRRRPRPSADEGVDPVSYSPEAPVAATAEPDQAPPAAPEASPPATQAAPVKTSEPKPPESKPATTKKTASADTPKRGPGRPRRQPAVQLGVRVSLGTSDLIDELATEDGSARAVIENAVRLYAESR